ncbi:sulfotransferase [Ideonella sp.]|uniref:sulfotransferase family protein n=1 Tax=Ideonella sp. TaxID=1929293 RepID=UPI002B47E3D4|nr:sulfotransferase [Ideonella sp.]HJV70899.1 sulfotransferase [Ideonella sp.]
MRSLLNRLKGNSQADAGPMLDLAELRRWCERSRPIFIVGLARSGTSMLQVAFAQHPSMFDIANCRETFIFLRPRQPYVDPIHFPTRAYLKGRPNLMALREWIEPYEEEFGELSEADSIRAFFYFAGNRIYPGRHPLEKTPGHLRKLDLIFEIFPQARILVCSRDPVDVVASYRKRLAKAQADGEPPEKSSWLDKGVDEMIGVFDRFSRLVNEAIPKYGPAMFMAPYDWLIDSPEESIRAICAFAGMEFVPTMVASEATGSKAEGKSEKAHAIQKRASDAHMVLAPEEIDKIQAACAPWLAQWNTPGVLG